MCKVSPACTRIPNFIMLYMHKCHAKVGTNCVFEDQESPNILLLDLSISKAMYISYTHEIKFSNMTI